MDWIFPTAPMCSITANRMNGVHMCVFLEPKNVQEKGGMPQCRIECQLLEECLTSSTTLWRLLPPIARVSLQAGLTWPSLTSCKHLPADPTGIQDSLDSIKHLISMEIESGVSRHRIVVMGISQASCSTVQSMTHISRTEWSPSPGQLQHSNLLSDMPIARQMSLQGGVLWL